MTGKIIKELRKYKLALLVIGVLIVLSPLFAWAAGKVGYMEPLEHAAEKQEAHGNSLFSGLFPDYTVPGLNIYLGTLIAGIVGVLVTLGFSLLMVKLLRSEG